MSTQGAEKWGGMYGHFRQVGKENQLSGANCYRIVTEYLQNESLAKEIGPYNVSHFSRPADKRYYFIFTHLTSKEKKVLTGNNDFSQTGPIGVEVTLYHFEKSRQIGLRAIDVEKGIIYHTDGLFSFKKLNEKGDISGEFPRDHMINQQNYQRFQFLTNLILHGQVRSFTKDDFDKSLSHLIDSKALDVRLPFRIAGYPI